MEVVETLAHLIDKLQSGELTARAAVLCCLARIEQHKELNAFITVCADRALIQADDMDRRRQRGEPLPRLAGVPMAIKDNIETSGIATTCASRALADYVPESDAEVMRRLYENGCILLGKLNMDELAVGSSSDTSAYGAVANPLDTSRVPGGSSGGSAAAVAAGLTAFSLGTDTGGSIRQPAALCGIVGINPTPGLISNIGVVPASLTLDRTGPLTRTVADCAIVMEALTGLTFNLDVPCTPLRVAVISEALDAASPLVALRVADAAAALGCRTRVSFDGYLDCMDTYSTIANSEFAELLRGNTAAMTRVAARAEQLGASARQRALYQTSLLAEAAARRRGIVSRFDELLRDYDVLLTPTSLETAPRFGVPFSSQPDACLVPSSLAGLPSLSVPCGIAENGLPAGVQLIGRAGADALLLRAAARLA